MALSANSITVSFLFVSIDLFLSFFSFFFACLLIFLLYASFFSLTVLGVGYFVIPWNIPEFYVGLQQSNLESFIPSIVTVKCCC